MSFRVESKYEFQLAFSVSDLTDLVARLSNSDEGGDKDEDNYVGTRFIDDGCTDWRLFGRCG